MPGTEKPVDIGVEDPDVVGPIRARATARLTVTEDLPTPALARRDPEIGSSSAAA